MADKRVIRLFAHWDGHGNQTDEIDLPEGWDGWTKAKREKWLQAAAKEFAMERLDYGGEVVEVKVE